MRHENQPSVCLGMFEFTINKELVVRSRVTKISTVFTLSPNKTFDIPFVRNPADEHQNFVNFSFFIATMFEFKGERQKTDDSKCYVHFGTMGRPNPDQPPRKRKPYSAVLAVPFVHKVT